MIGKRCDARSDRRHVAEHIFFSLESSAVAGYLDKPDRLWNQAPELFLEGALPVLCESRQLQASQWMRASPRGVSVFNERANTFFRCQ